MRRREFITFVGSAAAWPVVARAQKPGMQLLGYIHPVSPGPNAHLFAIIRQALADAGFVEGHNLTIDSRFAEGHYELLPQLVSELVSRSPAVIIAANTALAAKAASTVIPIVFSTADDPVTLGLVASIARPGGNVTGVHYFNTQLAAKQLGLLRELLPTAVRFGLLVNSSNTNAKAVKDEVTDAAIPLNVTIDVVEANNDGEIEAAFAVLATKRADALVVAADPLFYGRRVQLAKLATRYALPAIYNNRDYVEAGGLISYGTSLKEVYRLLGSYATRVLKGEKPADLPVVQSINFRISY
jgi:putative ABC transport system substrate-binding protein